MGKVYKLTKEASFPVNTITIDCTRKNCSTAAEEFECRQTVSLKVCRMIPAWHNVAQLGTLSPGGKMFLARHPPGLCWVDSGPSAPAFQVHYLGQGQSYSWPMIRFAAENRKHTSKDVKRRQKTSKHYNDPCKAAWSTRLCYPPLYTCLITLLPGIVFRSTSEKTKGMIRNVPKFKSPFERTRECPPESMSFIVLAWLWKPSTWRGQNAFNHLRRRGDLWTAGAEPSATWRFQNARLPSTSHLRVIYGSSTSHLRSKQVIYNLNKKQEHLRTSSTFYDHHLRSIFMKHFLGAGGRLIMALGDLLRQSKP